MEAIYWYLSAKHWLLMTFVPILLSTDHSRPLLITKEWDNITTNKVKSTNEFVLISYISAKCVLIDLHRPELEFQPPKSDKQQTSSAAPKATSIMSPKVCYADGQTPPMLRRHIHHSNTYILFRTPFPPCVFVHISKRSFLIRDLSHRLQAPYSH